MQIHWVALASALLAVLSTVGCDGAHTPLASPSSAPLASAGSATNSTSAGPTATRSPEHPADDPAKLAGLRTRVKHIIVIYQENWSFDSLYGTFPGANGIANAGATATQVDLAGHPYAALPTCYRVDDETGQVTVDPKIPAHLPMAPFNLSAAYKDNEITGDLIHRFFQEQQQIDGGRMDRFAAVSDAGGFVMSYYDGAALPEGKLAREYTLCDNFFHAAFGGSFLNHQWLIAARTPYWPDAPVEKRAKLFNGALVEDGAVTPDGYAVNTIYSVNKPWRHGKPGILPALKYDTIGDRLDGAKISWAWYAGGWDHAMDGFPDEEFQYHHQPFAYFARYGDPAQPGHAHLLDEMQFDLDLKTGQVPAVAFIKPLGDYNEHPGYGRLAEGQQHVGELVRAIQNSPIWPETIIVITYDENGGRWDHVPPPTVDAWGPGTRVPTLVISPFARRHYIDSTEYDTTSILRLIESRWELAPLSLRDQNANNLLNALDFSAP